MNKGNGTIDQRSSNQLLAWRRYAWHPFHRHCRHNGDGWSGVCCGGEWWCGRLCCFFSWRIYIYCILMHTVRKSMIAISFYEIIGFDLPHFLNHFFIFGCRVLQRWMCPLWIWNCVGSGLSVDGHTFTKRRHNFRKNTRQYYVVLTEYM